MTLNKNFFESQKKILKFRRLLRQIPEKKIKLSEYDDLCNKNEIEEGRKVLTALHILGDVVYDQDDYELSNYVITKPKVLQREFASVSNIDIIEEAFEEIKDRFLVIQQDYVRLNTVKKDLDRQARAYARRIIGGGFCAATAHGFVMMKLTWFTYGWDLIEPISYFCGYSLVLSSYILYLLFRRDWSYENIYGALLQTKKDQLYKRSQEFDLEEYQQVLRQHEELKKEFQDIIECYIESNIDISKRIEQKMSLDTL